MPALHFQRLPAERRFDGSLPLAAPAGRTGRGLEQPATDLGLRRSSSVRALRSGDGLPLSWCPRYCRGVSHAHHGLGILVHP
jgi:hypothetical protein